MLLTSQPEIFQQLRKNFEVFTYEKYFYALEGNEISITIEFKIGDSYTFSPVLRIPIKDFYNRKLILNLNNDELFRNIVFHIGLIELISYWKAACCPHVLIKAGKLDAIQLKWLKDVYYNGLGEFFYTNGIKTSIDSFMTIEANEGVQHQKQDFLPENQGLIPVGGGKDSAVTLELMKGETICRPFVLNPRKAIRDSILCAGYSLEEAVVINRSIDPQLLEMNKNGFLNGHTPFSALLGMISLMGAYLTDSKYIYLSNESSANEPSIPGTTVNHQYSKSISFERSFREYYKTYISESFEYLSFLRPLNELQIAALFSSFLQYHQVFRSCNAGSKEDIWCGNCSKCLFAAIILSPFLPEESINKIFGKEMFKDKNLLPDLHKLCGISAEKPFECIGTIDEVNIALVEILKKRKGKTLPLLLADYEQSKQYIDYQHTDFSAFLRELNEEHFLSQSLITKLTAALYDRLPG